MTRRGATSEAIARLQAMHDTLSGQDSELETVWDDICVQLQEEPSVFWDAYDETVRAVILRIVDAMPKYERDALWMQTNDATAWECNELEERAVYPVNLDCVVEYILRSIYEEAGNWSNPRIRAYLDRSSKVD